MALAQTTKEGLAASIPGPSATSDNAEEEMPEDERIAKAYATLNDRLSKLYTSLPKHTAFILFSGHSDPRAMSALIAQQNNFNRKWKSASNSLANIPPEEVWRESDMRELKIEVAKARFGISLYAVT